MKIYFAVGEVPICVPLSFPISGLALYPTGNFSQTEYLRVWSFLLHLLGRSDKGEVKSLEGAPIAKELCYTSRSATSRPESETGLCRAANTLRELSRFVRTHLEPPDGTKKIPNFSAGVTEQRKASACQLLSSRAPCEKSGTPFVLHSWQEKFTKHPAQCQHLKTPIPVFKKTQFRPIELG